METEEITSVQGPSWFPFVFAFGRCTYTYDPAADTVESLRIPFGVTINGRDPWGRRFTRASWDRTLEMVAACLAPKAEDPIK